MILPAKISSQVRQLRLHGLDIELASKRIKHIYLRVYSPHGTVKVSAPQGMPQANIAVFVAAKLGWIKKQQQKIQLRQRNLADLQPDDEGCCFQGQRYSLRVVADSNVSAMVSLMPREKEILVQLGSRKIPPQIMLERWYRQQLLILLPPLLKNWQEVLKVKCAQVKVRKMKTRWGSCTPNTAKIRINLELVKRAPSCLEYVVVHELLHLLESSHNRRFYALLDQYLPDWQLQRAQLNAIPLTS